MYLDLINQYVNIIINTITCKYFSQSMKCTHFGLWISCSSEHASTVIIALETI